MKGAIGNALILNIVITFMIIFFSLLIGSMAYSKAYKTKNYLINMIDKYENEKTKSYPSFKGKWDDEVNEYLGKIGYSMDDVGCAPSRDGGYQLLKTNENGYDYCIYRNEQIKAEKHDKIIKGRYNYMVLVYMKFDVPVLGNFIRIPITGETKSYNILR